MHNKLFFFKGEGGGWRGWGGKDQCLNRIPLHIRHVQVSTWNIFRSKHGAGKYSFSLLS